jgi:phosphoribosyl 1,2-cyclic phosphate phosphodiesterase
MTLAVTILGCGFSGGVPRPGLGWGACNPNNPKNRRRRCSILVERKAPGGAGGAAAGGLPQNGSPDGGTTRVLVDTSPDLREQLLDAGVDWLDGVLYTHEHADHTHGIDDLRGLFIRNRRRIDIYADAPTWNVLSNRFSYCFETPPGSNYPPILTYHAMAPGEPVSIAGASGTVTALPVLHDHGDIPALGFRFGAMAYSPDLIDMPAESAAALQGLDLWIVDALWYRQHPSHFHLDLTLAWIERLKPRRAILTNMHSDLDYDVLRAKLPAHVQPAYDGMCVEIED